MQPGFILIVIIRQEVEQNATLNTVKFNNVSICKKNNISWVHTNHQPGSFQAGSSEELDHQWTMSNISSTETHFHQLLENDSKT